LRERGLRRESEGCGKHQAGNARTGHVDLSLFMARGASAQKRARARSIFGSMLGIEIVGHQSDWLCKN
jgi:hypothetical protein